MIITEKAKNSECLISLQIAHLSQDMTKIYRKNVSHNHRIQIFDTAYKYL